MPIFQVSQLDERKAPLLINPGLRDLNSTRQNITENYIRQCDRVFAVARIGRATTDQGVRDVFKLAEDASLYNVGIIYTISDM